MHGGRRPQDVAHRAQALGDPPPDSPQGLNREGGAGVRPAVGGPEEQAESLVPGAAAEIDGPRRLYAQLADCLHSGASRKCAVTGGRDHLTLHKLHLDAPREGQKPDPSGAHPSGHEPHVGNGDLAPAAQHLHDSEVAEGFFLHAYPRKVVLESVGKPARPGKCVAFARAQLPLERASKSQRNGPGGRAAARRRRRRSPTTQKSRSST